MTTIKIRRGQSGTGSGKWGTVNPTLEAGEFGFELDTGKLKIGDGTTAWNSLTYVTDASKITGTSLSSTVVSSSLTSVGTLTNLTVTNPINGSITGSAFSASVASSASVATGISGGTGSFPKLVKQTAANTTSFINPGTTGQILLQSGSGPSWTNKTPFLIASGTATASAGAISVTFSTQFSQVPIVTATVLDTTTDKPCIFVLNSVSETGFTGQVWVSSNTTTPFNDFVKSQRTIHWTAIQLTSGSGSGGAI